MVNLDNYECEGQMTLTEYMQTLVKDRRVMDLTEYINSQGKAQYTQVKELITKYITDEDLIDSLTNHVSVWVLRQSMGYMDYLRKEARQQE